MAKSTIAQFEKSLEVMVNMQAGSKKLVDQMVKMGMKDHSQQPIQKVRDARQKLHQCINVFETAINFQIDKQNDKLTNSTAFKYLAEGGSALEKTLQESESAKAMMKVVKMKE